MDTQYQLHLVMDDQVILQVPVYGEVTTEQLSTSGRAILSTTAEVEGHIFTVRVVDTTTDTIIEEISQ